jgi:hypothetical protein
MVGKVSGVRASGAESSHSASIASSEPAAEI